MSTELHPDEERMLRKAKNMTEALVNRLQSLTEEIEEQGHDCDQFSETLLYVALSQEIGERPWPDALPGVADIVDSPDARSHIHQIMGWEWFNKYTSLLEDLQEGNL